MENKVKFATAYEPNKQVRSKLDRRDNVNRVSYVDSTAYVQRMICEGQNLIAHRAKAMRSGLYKVEDALKENESVPAIPVYEQDPVIMSKTLDSFIVELNSCQKLEQTSVEKGIELSESDKVDVSDEITEA